MVACEEGPEPGGGAARTDALSNVDVWSGAGHGQLTVLGYQVWLIPPGPLTRSRTVSPLTTLRGWINVALVVNGMSPNGPSHSYCVSYFEPEPLKVTLGVPQLTVKNGTGTGVGVGLGVGFGVGFGVGLGVG